MAFLDMNFDDVVEPTVAPADAEYKLRILDVKEGTNKNSEPYLMPRFEICDVVGAKDFTKYLGLPAPSMDAKKLNNTKYALKTFMDAFGLEYASDPADWVGAEGWAILGVEENEQYGPQNYVKKFVKA